MTEPAAELSPRERVGFIGLGIMGAPMVRNLLRAGFEVVAWNRSPGRLEAAVEAGRNTALRRLTWPRGRASSSRA